MPDENAMTLEQEYETAITGHRDYLLRLQNAFNAHCDEIAKKTADQLEKIAAGDQEGRARIYAEQKNELDTALSQLKKEIENSAKNLRLKLEEINEKREKREISELEEMIKNMETPKPGTKDDK